MAIRKLIEEQTEIPANLEKERKRFIQSAGTLQKDSIQEKPVEWKVLQLRIKQEAVNQIDQIVSDTMGISRTGWILQAIEEKLKGKDHNYD